MAAAAPDSGPVAEMESLLTCSICLETLKEPRTLGCFHSFCKCCLQKDVKRQREMKKGKVIETFDCPLCRTQFSLKQGEKVEEMLPNHFIGNMLEVLKIQLRAKKLPCFFCGSQRPAVSRCITCDKYLCNKCLTAHNNWPDFNEHVVLTMDELAKPENQTKARGKPRCPKHEKKTLKFYCETCKELVCSHCIVLDHAKPNHSCLPIDEVAEKRRELLKASSVILHEQHKEGNEVLQKIEANTESLKNNANKAKDDITQQKKAILKAFTQKLEEKAALMINEVDKKYNEVYEPLTQQKTDVKAYVDKVKGSMDVAKNRLEKGSHEEVIYIQKLVEENVAKVKNERPWIMKPIHDGNIQFKAKPIVRMDNGKSGNILNDLGEVVCDPVIKPEYCIDVTQILNDRIKAGEENMYQKPSTPNHRAESVVADASKMLENQCYLCSNISVIGCEKCGKIVCKDCLKVLRKAPCISLNENHTYSVLDSKDTLNNKDTGLSAVSQVSKIDQNHSGVREQLTDMGLYQKPFLHKSHFAKSVVADVGNRMLENKCYMCNDTSVIGCKKCKRVACRDCVSIMGKNPCISHEDHEYYSLDSKDTKWQCKHCTYINSPETTVCVACSRSKDFIEPQLTTGDWICDNCTLVNPSSLKQCNACKDKKSYNRYI